MTLPKPAPDSTALVTGASSGIGVEIARELARRGHGVTLVARRADRLHALAAELSAAHGVRAEVIAADLADAAARPTLLAAVADRGLRVEILCNNAGVGTVGPVAAADADSQLQLLRVDVEALVDLTTRVLPGMVERGRGGILHTASTAAFQPIPGMAAYAAAKAFVLSYAQSTRQELKGTGVTVTALCPGPVRTEFTAAAGMSEEEFHSAFPGFLFESAAAVAKTGVDALAAGRGVAIPGIGNEIAARIGAVIPRRLLLPVLARQNPRGR